MKRGRISMEVMVVLLLCSTAYATTWYVHPDSTLNSIQVALFMCSTGDTVLVGPGTYVENILWPATQSIYLQSEYGPDTTIIDGNLAGWVIVLVSQTDSATTIDGFTITHGTGTGAGGGIRCRYSSSVTVVGCIVDSNTTSSGGAGIYCGYNSSAVIMNNTISNNVSVYGGAGIDCGDTSHVTIMDNIIIGNTSTTAAGGGILICENSTATITGNTITANSAVWGGGISFMYDVTSAIVKHNIITGNTCVTPPPEGAGGIDIYGNCSPYIDSCTLADNYDAAIVCDVGSNPVINYCNIWDTVAMANIDSIFTVDAQNNWWGDASGPYHPTLNPGGLGGTVSDYVDFDPWLGDSVEWVGIQEETQISNDKCQMIRLQVSPNPFRHFTDIRWQMTDNSQVNLRIYDATGRLVKSFRPTPNALHNTVSWDATDDKGRHVPSGVYFLKFSAGNYSATEKLLLIR